MPEIGPSTGTSRSVPVTLRDPSFRCYSEYKAPFEAEPIPVAFRGQGLHYKEVAAYMLFSMGRSFFSADFVGDDMTMYCCSIYTFYLFLFFIFLGPFPCSVYVHWFWLRSSSSSRQGLVIYVFFFYAICAIWFVEHGIVPFQPMPAVLCFFCLFCPCHCFY